MAINLEKLRQSKAEYDASQREEGRRAGREWAAGADFPMVKRVAALDGDRAADQLWGVIRAESLRAEEMFGYDADLDGNEALLEGFVEGVSEIYCQI